MTRLQWPAIIAGVAMAWAWCLPASHAVGQDDFEDRIAVEEQEGVELLARGPVHEAFAEPVVPNPEGTLVVAVRPPDPIDEVPPEYKPEGDNVIWIPGYWAWEDEREDFIWISGIWRNIPPGQRWVPGYWAEVSDGFQWVPGFWMTEEEEEIVYYPTPPESLEQGPTVEAPDDDHFWVPGVWVYETDWLWRPGYWAEYQPDWVWVPARWVWTPHGCVYLSGFWDYQPTYRGFLFAPVYFNRPVYQTVGYRYTPWYALRTTNLFVHFWVRPNYCHYYFGNYYGHHHVDYGIRPWISWGHSHRHWDPILAYNRVRYAREGINYVQRIDRWHDYFVRHEHYRPAVTVRQQINLVNNINIEDNDIINRINIGSPLREFARTENTALRLARVEERQREVFAQRASQIRDVYRARLQEERRDARDRVADSRDAADRGRGPTGRTRLPRVDVADLTGGRDGDARTRVPRQLDPGRPGADRTRDTADRARDSLDRTRDTADRARDTADRAGDTAADRARDAADRARDTAADRARDALDRGRDVTDRGRDIADRARDAAADRGRDAADRTRDLTDRTRDAADRARDAARDRTRDAASRARDLTDRPFDSLDRADTGRSAAERALDRSLDRAPGRSLTDRALDRGPTTSPGRSLTDRALDRGPTTLPGRGLDRSLDSALDRTGRSSFDRDAAARSALDRARGARPGLDRTPTPGLGSGFDRPGLDRAGLDRPSRSGSPDLDLGRPSGERARLDLDRGPTTRPRPDIGPRSGSPARSSFDRGRPGLSGGITDLPGSTIRSRTPSPYRPDNDRLGGLDALRGSSRREVLRPGVGGPELRGTAPGVTPGFDRSPSTPRTSGRRAPTGLDLDRLRGADRAGGQDVPAMRPSGLGVGNSLNTPGVGGPGRGSAGPSRAADRPVSDGPGAGGPDDRARGRGRGRP